MPEVQCQVPQSVMVWGAMSAAGCGPLCFIKGRVKAVTYQEILEHFMLASADIIIIIIHFIYIALFKILKVALHT